MKCPHCGFDNPPGMKFCGMCGTRLARACPACNFANPPDFHFCGQCGRLLIQEPGLTQPPQPQFPVEAEVPTPPPPAPVQLEGERRRATVILTDVRGSTDLLEQIGSEEWVDIMNRVLHILESEVYRFGGEVDQFRGDGLVAFFGARSAHEDDPERAVLAGLAMQTAIKPYAAELAEQEDIDLQLRVGINTGEVIVTSVGDSRQHSEDTAMGAGIALAARMETAAEPGTVLVSENTYRLVESQFEWEPLGEITVKGMSQPVAVYRPLAPQADADWLHRLQTYGLSIPLIGREVEFHTLKGCVEDLYDGRGGIVMVTGDKGLGKSFLVAEVRHHFARHGALLAEARASGLVGDRPERGELPPASGGAGGVTWLRGRCRSYDQSWPYSMWLDLLQGWLGMRSGETEEETRNRFRRQAELLWGDRMAEHYPYLATFLSLPLEETFAERVKHLDAEGLRQQFFFALRSWVEVMAKRGPLVLAFADVHWADTTSLDLLKYCLPLCDDEALLWLIVFRPDRTAPVWEFRHRVETEYPHRVTTVIIPPLTEAQSGEFIDQLIGPETLPAETRVLVLDKAEGNPYYMGELIRSLIAQGVLVQEAETGQWRATRAVASLDLPDTLQSLLMARIDSLSSEERRVLQMAAVIGSVFWSNVLQALAGDAAAPEAGALKAHLTALQRAQLIQERGRAPDLGMEYVFKSNLIRDAACEGILSAQRVTYHLKVAEYLEDLCGLEALTPYYGVLAYHYRQAGNPGKELFYTVQAAEQAKKIYANVEVLEHYTRALELLDEMETQAAHENGNRLYAIRTQRFEVLNGRREVFYIRGDFEAGWADAQALLPLAQQLDDDPVWLIDALLQQPNVAHWRSREELIAGIPMAEEALALARQLGDRRREMQSLVAIASQRLWVNDPTAWETAEHALDLARQLGDRSYEVGILLGMGGVYAWSDQPERGMEYLEAALPICQTLDDKMAEMDLLNLIGLQFERSGDYHRLLTEYHQKRLHISREIGHRPVEGDALMHCGQIQSLRLGDYEAGLALLEECLRLWEGFPGELFALLRVAQIQVAQGRYDEALATLERARHIGEQNVRDMGRAGLRLVPAILYNALGGETHLREALELAAQTRQLVADAPLTQQYEMAAACESATAHLGLAECAAGETERQAHLDQALESSQVALDIYQHFGFVQIIECASEKILYRHSLTLAANGHEAEAAAYLQRAYDEMKRKHDLIPPDSPFRRTYLENIPLHQNIQAAYAA
ncbi:MAG: adenylate/guanylate cyclase domain-containing protein [Anaerolineae bacterium]